MQLWWLWTLCLSSCTAKHSSASSIASDPQADPQAVVVFGPARFTILTDCLLRLELSKFKDHPKFDDRATFTVINRRLPVPQFSLRHPDPSTVLIKTSSLQLTYRQIRAPSEGFTADNLNIQLLGPSLGGLGAQVIWQPGTVDALNLNGTMDIAPAGFAGGWDCYSTPEECSASYPRLIGPGLLSRSGWAVVNDTNTTRFASHHDGDKFPWLDGSSTRKEHRPLVEDLYFLAPGLDFKRGLSAWAQISGRPALPPLAAFGVWFSHFARLSAEENLQIIDDYQQRGLPINLLVLDVPWHYDQYNESLSKLCNNWGGFTPNATLFPDFVAFLQKVHDTGVHVVTSNHMQVGISSCEEHYTDMAAALGMSAEFVENREVIPCALDNKTWVQALFKSILDQRTLRNIDYWWNDFPGCATDITGWDAQAPATLFWADYVFDYHQRLRNQRSILLSRYGGLGSHRMGIGFSGDVFQNFSTLQAEVEFSQTASNVLFGFWSHDVGGFHNGTDDPGDNDPNHPGSAELFLRWVQFGVFSPIFRTHGEPPADRYVWDFSTFPQLKDLMVLRNALVPYIYTMAWTSYNTGVSLLRPLYYSFGREKNAYDFKGQYMFGEHILVAPITSSTNTLGVAEKSVWLPPSTKHWMTWCGSKSFSGNQVLRQDYSISEVPVFLPAGSMLPMRTLSSVHKSTADPLKWVIWLGNAVSGEGLLYEDSGDQFHYTDPSGGQEEPIGWATTTASFSKQEAQITVNLDGTKGTYDGQLSSREFIIELRGLQSSFSPKVLAAVVNGNPVEVLIGSAHDHSYWSGSPASVLLKLGRHDIRQALTVSIVLQSFEYI